MCLTWDHWHRSFWQYLHYASEKRYLCLLRLSKLHLFYPIKCIRKTLQIEHNCFCGRCCCMAGPTLRFSTLWIIVVYLFFIASQACLFCRWSNSLHVKKSRSMSLLFNSLGTKTPCSWCIQKILKLLTNLFVMFVSSSAIVFDIGLYQVIHPMFSVL